MTQLRPYFFFFFSFVHITCVVVKNFVEGKRKRGRVGDFTHTMPVLPWPFILREPILVTVS
jgi:hypothetical protein